MVDHVSGNDGAHVDTPESSSLQSTSDSGSMSNTSRQTQDSPLGQWISGLDTWQSGNVDTIVMGLLTYPLSGNETSYQGTASESFISESSPVSSDNAQQLDLGHGGLQTMSADEMAQRNWGWQPVDSHPGTLMPEDSDLVALDPTMPTVLEYWDWQGLDLGHPAQWHDSPSPLSGQ